MEDRTTGDYAACVFTKLGELISSGGGGMSTWMGRKKDGCIMSADRQFVGCQANS
jgi:hypothetical protein